MKTKLTTNICHKLMFYSIISVFSSMWLCLQLLDVYMFSQAAVCYPDECLVSLCHIQLTCKCNENEVVKTAAVVYR